MIRYLEKALNLRREEVLPATLLFAYLFLVLSAYISSRAAAKGLFVSTFRDYVPHAIIGTSLFIGAFVSVYIRLSHRLKLESLIISTLLFFCATFAALLWMTSVFGKWVYPAVYVFVYTVGVMGPTMGWTLANYVLTTREARRIFGFLGAGAILGGILGGFLVPLVTRSWPAEMLLLAPPIFLGTCALLVKLLFQQTRQRLAGLQQAPVAGAAAPKSFFQSLAFILSSRYLTLITAIIAVGSTTTTIIDWQFQIIASDYYPGNKEALAGFFGSFEGYMGVAAFLLQLILTGRLLRSFGLRVTLFVLPVAFVAGSVGVLLIPTLLAVSVLKGSQGLLRYSLDKSSAELLFLPVAPDIKAQVKSFIDTFIWRAADGVAGIVLWIFATKLSFGPSRISLVNFVFLGGWIAIAWGVRREYLNVLRRAIERRTLDPERTATGTLDATTTGVMALALERGDEQQVLYGLSLFELSGQPGRHPMLPSLLNHPSSAVRQRVLRLLGDAGDREILPQVEKMLGDQSPEVRTEVMHYLVVHAGRDPLSLLSADTDLPDYSLQGSVVAYLARTGQPENFDAAQLILQDMLTRTGLEGPRARAEAARVLGMIPPPSQLHYELVKLLREEDLEVVEQALLSAGNIGGREFLPLVVEKLGHRGLAMVARTALAQYGERAVGTLQDYLNDAETPLAVRKQIPGVLARIPTAQSSAVLANSLIQSDPGLRFDVLKALNKLRRREPALVPPSPEFEDILQAELMGYYRSFQILAAVDPRASTSLRTPASEGVLTRALRERMDHELERIFRLLALLYPPRDIHNAFVGLTSTRAQLQANALEVLEHLLRPELYRLLAYVLDTEITLQQKLSFAQQLCRITVGSKAEALRILLHSEDRWLRVCALHAVGDWKLAELGADLRQMTRDSDPLLEETWKWANARLATTATA